MQRNVNNNYREIGDVGEEATANFLLKNGYEILKRNYTVRGGEVDIIAKKNDVIAFVEVKTRGKNPIVTGENAITNSKKQLIIKTAERFLLTLNEPCNCRFDVAVVEAREMKVVRLKYYVSAFDASK